MVDLVFKKYTTPTFTHLWAHSRVSLRFFIMWWSQKEVTLVSNEEGSTTLFITSIHLFLLYSGDLQNPIPNVGLEWGYGTYDVLHFSSAWSESLSSSVYLSKHFSEHNKKRSYTLGPKSETQQPLLWPRLPKKWLKLAKDTQLGTLSMWPLLSPVFGS